jgi:hypothetical protein
VCRFRSKAISCSRILSKAMLLAHDTKITDPAITSQISPS